MTVNSTIGSVSVTNGKPNYNTGDYKYNFLDAQNNTIANEGELNAIAETALKIASANATSWDSAHHSTTIIQNETQDCSQKWAPNACQYHKTSKIIHYAYKSHYYSDSYSYDSSLVSDIGKNTIIYQKHLKT